MRTKQIFALVAAATLALSACGDGESADSATIEALRASATDSELFTVLSEDEQDCLFENIAKNEALTEAILADQDPTNEQLAEVFSIMADCAPDALIDVLAEGDPEAAAVFEDLEPAQLQCVVDAIGDNPDLLAGDAEQLGLVLFDCAPDLAADLFATELGIDADQAECLIDELGGIEALIALGGSGEEPDAATISQVFAAFETCGIDITTLG